MQAFNSEADLLGAFRELDRNEVELPSDVEFPLHTGDLYTWAIGPRAFLVFREHSDAPPKGIVFHRNSGAMPDVAAMCEWCFSVRGHGAVKLLTAQTDRRRSVGLFLCSDLSCLRKVHEVPGPDDLHERLNAHDRASRTLARIATFANKTFLPALGG
jgi:hypothetical protein